MSDTDQVTAPAKEDTAVPGPATLHEVDVPADELAQKIEAALMATDRPVTTARLSEAIAPQGGRLSAKAIKKAVDSLNKSYEKTHRTFRVEEVAGGYQILTLPAFGPVVAAMNRTRAQTKLSPSALETLAIIAYKQPVLKAAVEAIRGAASGEIIRTLMERKLVKIVGRAEELGRPMLYGTTKTFLEIFGLANLKDLPKVEELKGKV